MSDTPELLRTCAGAKSRIAFTLRELIGRLERERLPLDCKAQGRAELALLQELLAVLRRPSDDHQPADLKKLERQAIAELEQEQASAAVGWEEVLGRP